jgi:hypothetical protein
MYIKSVVRRSKGLNDGWIGAGDKHIQFLETVISLSHMGNCVLLIDLTVQIIFQLRFNLRTHNHGITSMQAMFLGLRESEKV